MEANIVGLYFLLPKLLKTQIAQKLKVGNWDQIEKYIKK
jgi:hypothetical protein